MMNLLLSLFLIPLIGSLGIMTVRNLEKAKVIGLNVALLNFALSLVLWLTFDESSVNFQRLISLSFINQEFYLGVDGISVLFIVLTCFLIPVCLLTGWSSITRFAKEYVVCFLLMESLMIGVFIVLDVFLFYIFFESVLIPMFLIIGIWGSRERKIRASYQFFLFTLAGSLIMLLGLLLIYFQAGTTNILSLYSVGFSESRELVLWLCFFASFAVKVPMIPVHIWLPEAHVEAPTAGSVLLSGVMLKLGTYGLCRFSIPLFPFASVYFAPLVLTLSLLGIVYISLITSRQVDMKKVIAYSSVAHMNFVTLGLFSLNTPGIEGSLLLMYSHGLISPALFFLIGALYDRHHTRVLSYYGGCIDMPVFSLLFIFFTLSNISMPGTSGFVGEFLVLTGTFVCNSVAGSLASSGMVLGAVYALWLANRLLYGVRKVVYISGFSDLSRREVFILLPFVFFVVVFGVYPGILLDTLYCSIGNILFV